MMVTPTGGHRDDIIRVLRDALANNQTLISETEMSVSQLIQHVREMAHQQSSIIRSILFELEDIETPPPTSQVTVLPSANVVALQVQFKELEDALGVAKLELEAGTLATRSELEILEQTVADTKDQLQAHKSDKLKAHK